MSKKKLGTIESLERAGVHTARTEHIRDRVKGFEELLEEMKKDVDGNTPLETLKNFDKRTLEFAGKVRIHAIPWAKAGTDPDAGELVAVWERMGGLVMRDIALTRELLLDYAGMEKTQKSEETKEKMLDISWSTVRTEMMIIEKEYYSRTLILAAKCWRGEDMTVEDAVTIMSNVPPRVERVDVTRDNAFGVE